ncbi:hypothetical protein pb186bvf_010156 [Paramecium bursaria]
MDQTQLIIVIGLIMAFAYFIFNFIKCHMAKPNYESIDEEI